MHDEKDSNHQQQSETKIAWEYAQPKDGTAFIYGNHILLDWTINDVHIRISELSVTPIYRTPPNQKILKLEERAAVTLTWGTAKYLMGELQAVIKKYEEINGEIKVPQVP